MPTLKYLGETFDCTTAIKGDNYIHLLDDNGVMVAAFDAITDFSGFTLENGSYVSPTADHSCRVAVIRDDGTIGVGGHTCEDIGNAVPKTRKVNGKPLSADIAITGDDIEGIYSKDAVLKDQTKNMFGLGADAVPDDVFRCLGESALPKVGDTLTTFRTDLGDNWALCNGDWFDPSEYPDLARVTPRIPAMLNATKATGFYTIINESEVYTFKPISFCEGGGYQVGIWLYRSGSYNYPCLVYSTDWFATYKAKIIVPSQTDFNNAIVRYIDNRFVIAAVYGSYMMYFGSFSDIENDSITLTHNHSQNTYTIYDIWKENNAYYMAVSGYAGWSSNSSYKDGRESFILSTASLTSPTWTRMSPTADNVFYPYNFVRANGLYTFHGYYNGKHKLQYATSPNGMWTGVETTFPSEPRVTIDGNSCVRYYPEDNLWVRVGYNNDEPKSYTSQGQVSQYKYVLGIAWTHDIVSGNWECVKSDIELGNYFTSPGTFVRLPNGHYVWFSDTGNYMLYAKNIKDVSTWEYMQVKGTYLPSELCKFPSSSLDKPFWPEKDFRSRDTYPRLVENHWILWFMDLPTTATSQSYTRIMRFPLCALPTVTNSDSYTYMKVKEAET